MSKKTQEAYDAGYEDGLNDALSALQHYVSAVVPPREDAPDDDERSPVDCHCDCGD